MRQSLRGILIGAAAVVATSSFAFAGEQVLEFKLVTRLVNPTTVVEAANIEGQTMIASKAVGVAYFKDGRVASKDFILTLDLRNGSGPYKGYSTYTFEDGSSITASFTGERKAGESHGIYTIVSGTGTYANATGTGSFDSVPTKFKDAILYNGKFEIKTPEKRMTAASDCRPPNTRRGAPDRGEHRQAAKAFTQIKSPDSCRG
jgi:hypothetical protein